MDISLFKFSLGGKPLAVMGLGQSGLATLDCARDNDIATMAWDDDAAKRKSAADMGFAIVDPMILSFAEVGAFCVAPGIPLTHPAVLRAKAEGCEVLGDVEIFGRAKPDARTIGITGTNGKSTTTALIAHILEKADFEVGMGGNIGVPVLSLPDIEEYGIYVLELSSYQLDLCPTFAPRISVLTNVAPDHIERHGDMAGYIAAKERIFRGEGVAVIGTDDIYAEKIRTHIKGRLCLDVRTNTKRDHGISVTPEGLLYDGARKVTDFSGLHTLRGRHNWQNAALAYAACKSIGISDADILGGIKTFAGLAHRQFLVRTIGGVSYINDSKGTNDPATAVALATYNPLYWIAGGKSKGVGYDMCAKYFSHVRHAFLIGDAQEELAGVLSAAGVALTRSGTMEKAVEAAHAMAQAEKLSGAAVLLSPACASFDQFKNFEQRGDVFTNLVEKLSP